MQVVKDCYTIFPPESTEKLIIFQTISKVFTALCALGWSMLNSSMSQRYCWGVRALASVSGRGHWKEPDSNRLYRDKMPRWSWCSSAQCRSESGTSFEWSVHFCFDSFWHNAPHPAAPGQKSPWARRSDSRFWKRPYMYCLDSRFLFEWFLLPAPRTHPFAVCWFCRFLWILRWTLSFVIPPSLCWFRSTGDPLRILYLYYTKILSNKKGLFVNNNKLTAIPQRTFCAYFSWQVQRQCHNYWKVSYSITRTQAVFEAAWVLFFYFKAEKLLSRQALCPASWPSG